MRAPRSFQASSSSSKRSPRFWVCGKTYGDEHKLAAMLSQLTVATQTNKDPSPVISDLIEAATPIDTDGKQEVLYDAAIWLRYVMLLAYENQDDSAVGSGGNSLSTIWSKYKLAAVIRAGPFFNWRPQITG